MAGATMLGTAPVDPATGQATFSTTAISLGANTITATYSGDSNFLAGQNASSRVNVSAAATRSVMTAQAVWNKRGKIVSVNLVSQVLVASPGSGLPTGMVTIFRGGRALQGHRTD